MKSQWFLTNTGRAVPKKSISEALHLIFQGIECLKTAFPHRSFTIDGRVVGDVGEIIASLEYDIVLHEVSQPDYDATTSDGRKVQIKATFKDSLTFKTVPDYYLGFKLYPDGRFDEIFNGPGRIIYDRYCKRKGIGVVPLSFPISELRKLSAAVPAEQRILRRKINDSADPEGSGDQTM